MCVGKKIVLTLKRNFFCCRKFVTSKKFSSHIKKMSQGLKLELKENRFPLLFKLENEILKFFIDIDKVLFA